MRERAARVAGWSVIGVLCALGLSGAAASPEGMRLGLPGPAGLVLVVAVLAALAALKPPHAIVAAWIGLGWLPVALLLGLPLPGLGAWSGPPLLAFVLAAAASALAARRVPWAERLFFPMVLVVYLLVAGRVQSQVGAEGDEPHYLMVTESLLRDHDVDLTDDYVKARYQGFYRGETLEPHYRVRGKQDRIYSLHALGLSLLVLPAYALWGYAGASFFMALLGALLVRELRLLIRDWGGPDWVAWVVAFSPPLVHYAGLVFTEVPAALGVALALRRAREPRGLGRAVGLGAILAFLPWLNVRYAPVSLILLAYALLGRPVRRHAVALAAPMVLSLVALAAYHQALYGFADPRRVYGPRPELALRRIPEGLQGLLLDQEFGLLVYAPFLLLALPGFVALVREGRRRDAVATALMVGAVIATAASWPMWRGGFNPPGRFLVPIVPVLAVTASLALRQGLGARAALLAGWSLWLGLAGASEPRLVHRDRDGTAPLLRAASGAVEWTRLLPSYVLSEPDRHRLAWVWGSALVVAILPRRRRALTAAGLAAASAGLLGAAGIAQALSDAKAGGREAVHVLGRPCLQTPGWRVTRTCEAEWGTDVLDWGPAYEPHRHPDGAVLGNRLELPPGRFRLILDVAEPSPASEPPILELEGEAGGGRAVREEPLVRRFEGLEASFSVDPGERRTTLRLRGGSAWVMRRVRLLVQPSGVPPV